MTCFRVFIFLICFGVIFCDEDSEPYDAEKYQCIADEYQKCTLLEENYPETSDGLLTFCKNRAARRSCLLQADENCGSDVTQGERDELNFIESLCDKDNPIFKVISANLQCIKQYTKYKALCNDFERIQSRMNSSIEKLESRIWEEEDPEERICLSQRLMSICQPLIIGYTCNNDEVKEAAKKVIEAGRRISECTPENLEKVNPILEEYEAKLFDELISYE